MGNVTDHRQQVNLAMPWDRVDVVVRRGDMLKWRREGYLVALVCRLLGVSAELHGAFRGVQGFRSHEKIEIDLMAQMRLGTEVRS